MFNIHWLAFSSWQLDLWKRYITFEKSNPLRSEDTALVTRRVMFATEQCLLVLTHHPAVWHQAAQYLDQSAKLLTEKGVRSFTIFPIQLTVYARPVWAGSIRSMMSSWLGIKSIQQDVIQVEEISNVVFCPFYVICPMGLAVGRSRFQFVCLPIGLGWDIALIAVHKWNFQSIPQPAVILSVGQAIESVCRSDSKCVLL